MIILRYDYDPTTTYSLYHNRDSTVIRLKFDYNVSCAPASIQHEQKMNMSIFHRGHVVVVSQSNRMQIITAITFVIVKCIVVSSYCNCDIGLILLSCGRFTECQMLQTSMAGMMLGRYCSHSASTGSSVNAFCWSQYFSRPMSSHRPLAIADGYRWGYVAMLSPSTSA